MAARFSHLCWCFPIIICNGLIRPELHEHTHNFNSTSEGSFMKYLRTTGIPSVQIGALVYQELNRFNLPTCDRSVQRSITVFIFGAKLKVSTTIQQNF